MSQEFSEDKLVQETTSNFFKNELHWDSEYAYNTEVLGKDETLGRTTEKEVVLKKFLNTSLRKFNPDLPENVYDSAIKQITEISYTRPVLQQNKEKYELFTNGVLVTYKHTDGSTKKSRLKVFDFDNPENNHFLIVRELWIQGLTYRRRADILGFVNGIPLLFMELKTVHKNVKNAYDHNLKDYRDTIPQLFVFNAMIMLSNGDRAKVGTISSEYEHFMDWKRLKEEDEGSLDFEIMLRGMCTKSFFIDLFENFILFDESLGESIKIIAKNHQYLGVNLAVEAVKNRKTLNGKLGVFWHTQGSGKSYSMVFLSKKVRQKVHGNFTFLVVTDREDLDKQIYDTFVGVGLVKDKECRASSGKHLKKLFKEDHIYLFTMIHKFNIEITKDDFYSDRSDIIVLSDETHRTQYGTLALNMRNALPNAAFLGFTGTPLFKDDEITRRVFGEYVSTYDFKRAVDDGSTVPLYYESRGEKLNLSTENINEKIAEALEAEELDLDQKALLEKELSREYHIITSEKRLDAIAKDFVEHYSLRWESGKAMFICIDKVTTVRMYNLIQEYWKKNIKELTHEQAAEKDVQEKILLLRKIEWMSETGMAVILSEEQGEIEKFRKWDLDIEVHRKLIKNGFETENGERIDIETAFKKKENPFRVAFVCAMWLTGFDVKTLATLYLDKPLKAHTLMQAIARANRVSEGKGNGLVVDYCGILKNLRKALAAYGSGNTDGTGADPTTPDTELIVLLAEAIEEVRSYLSKYGFQLEEIFAKDGFAKIRTIRDAKEAINVNDETRKGFEVRAREVFKKFKAAFHLVEEINRYRREYNAINVIYKKLSEDREKADISKIIMDLHKVIEENIEPEISADDDNMVFDISSINFDLLKDEFKKSDKKHSIVQELTAAINKKLERLIRKNPLRVNLQERYSEIIENYNKEKDRQTIEQTFQDLFDFVRDLDKEEKRTVKENLNEENLALFDLLCKPGLSKKSINKLKKLASELLITLKSEKLKMDHWREKETTRAEVKQYIQDYLWAEQTGLPIEDFKEPEVYNIADKVYEHIFRQYESADENEYVVA